ncbi:aldo/keto reductase [Mucisphaera calidilacus]|uniref:D-threo-aldose 1-dehydrogenase n=1 Tax=Mucisphaera calidilacus TaxID=2527982 RepID=A0A518BZA1_9BACT|nr:aldo/keto reductase [Mucisphaera calidilacus]QDU72303.1 D-threo-aldose 1-dehydrogenase [Mucisphaera calidilacus]
MDVAVTQRPLGRTGMSISPIGFGAFKIGRNTGIKYERGYELPSDERAEHILRGVLDSGINHVDTAPAYGISEQRIGAAIADRRDAYILSTKVGETFEGGTSTYDFSPEAVTASVHRSLKRLSTDRIDVVLIHANHDDLGIMRDSGAPEALDRLKASGEVRAVGLSGKTPAGFEAALGWADVFMVEYHAEQREMADLITRAHERGVGVLIKKGLASGTLSADEAIRFVLGHEGVDSLTLGSLNLDHLRENLASAMACRGVNPGRG